MSGPGADRRGRFLVPSRGLPARHLMRRALARAVGAVSPAAPAASLRILTYHRVNDRHPGDRLSVAPAAFARQLEHLAASGRHVLGLEEALAALGGEGVLPARAVAITFDDGYLDNHRFAFPLLERFGFQATFFLATAYVGSPSVFPRYRGCCADDRGLGWDEVRELKASGHGIGGHTRSHPELGHLPLAEVEREIAGCREDIRRETGQAPKVFCYPRGSESQEVRRAVRDAGFAAACTVYPGANPIGCDPLALLRTEVSGDDTEADFACKLDGGFDGWHRLLQRLGRLRRAAPAGATPEG